MLSFKSLAFAAAVAFGALSTAFAAPAVVAGSDIAARGVSVRGVADIIVGVKADILPYVNELRMCI